MMLLKLTFGIICFNNGLAERKLSVRYVHIAQMSMNASQTTGTGLVKALVAISRVATSAIARISLGTN